MREEFLWTAEDYKDDKFENAIQDLVEQKNWKIIEKKNFPRYNHPDKDGVTFVFKIL